MEIYIINCYKEEGSEIRNDENFRKIMIIIDMYL